MAVVYQHRIPNKGDIFYIGIGKDKKRAFTKSNRNEFWHNVVNKYGYEIEILVEDVSWEVACEIEKELIKKYGRRCKNQGTLVNITEGGEGVLGLKHTEQAKAKMSNNRDIKISVMNIKKAVKINKGKRKIENTCTLQEIKEMYEEYTIEEISNKLGVSFPTVSKYLREKDIYIPRKNMKPPSAEKRQKVSKSLKGKGNKEVLQYSKNGEFINKFKSLTEASNKTNIKNSCISAVCNGKQKTAGGFKWKYALMPSNGKNNKKKR